MRSLVPLIFVLSLVPGIVYGYLSGRFRTHKDVVAGMTQAMSTMGYYLVLAFCALQFLAAFARSNLGVLIALGGADLLTHLALPGAVTIVGLIVVTNLVNLMMASSSAKWAVLAPVFVPMLMALGLSPELTQMAYRVGDSTSNILTPLNPYVPLAVVFCRKWAPDFGLGTLIARMVPYWAAFSLTWIPLLLIWWVLGLPLGLNAPYVFPGLSRPLTGRAAGGTARGRRPEEQPDRPNAGEAVTTPATCDRLPARPSGARGETPMDFTESPRVSAIRGLLREFVHKELHPLELRLRHEGFKALLPALQGVRERARGTGLWAAFMPEEYGGAGLSLTEFACMSEELGRSPLGHYAFNCQAPDVGNMEVLMKYGTADQKARFLLPLVRGDIRSCFTMTEPEFAGSNPVWLGTTARKDGDHWVIDGHKWFATGADGAAFAICMALTSPDAPEPHRRASLLLVPTDTPGFELIGNLSIMGERGGDWASHGEVMYRHARVPLDHLLGPEGMGFVIAQQRLGPGRIHHCMRWIGICERAFDLMCRHAATRQLAPGRPLGTRQMVQQWIAESRAEIHGARLMVLHAAWKIEHEGAAAARDEISMIKFTVARTLQRVLDRALQTLGGLGMTDDTPLAWWWAHERAARIYDGADEVHVEAVARRALRAHGLRDPRS